jgi:hypothetical protein
MDRAMNTRTPFTNAIALAAVAVLAVLTATSCVAPAGRAVPDDRAAGTSQTAAEPHVLGPLERERARQILAGCPKAASYRIPILSLSYFPVVETAIDPKVTGLSMSLADARTKVQRLELELIDALELGSAYRPEQDPSAGCSLDYEVVGTREYLEALPLGPHIEGTETRYPDYRAIVTREDICRAVDERGIRHVWLWGYHGPGLQPAESNMAGPYGDVSNSHQIDDLPKCRNTYVVYNYNYGRDVGMALEDHGHQIETVLNHLDESFFQTRFVQTMGKTGGARNGCGNVHIPPNATRDYDWYRTDVVLSDCDDWNPERTGKMVEVSCETWGCANDGGVAWKIWWMNHLPGRGNTFTYGGGPMRSWWDAMGDFDAVMASGTKLRRP